MADKTLPERPSDPRPTIAPEASVARFLASAAELAEDPAADAARLERFVRLYRAVVMGGRGVRNSALDADRTRMLVHGMVGAATLREGLEIFVEFIPTLFRDTRVELRDEGAQVVLVFHERHGADPLGLVCALWPLIVAATELEFLAGGRLDGLVGRVTSEPRLPKAVVELLFRRPLTYLADETALSIPKVHLARQATARAADVSGFIEDFFLATLGGRRPPRDLVSSTADVIRFNLLRGGAGEAANLPGVANELGCSVAALRRRLRACGARFRDIKEEVLDDLAKTWLRDTRLTVEEIAEKARLR